jgi:hypothetical protein
MVAAESGAGDFYGLCGSSEVGRTSCGCLVLNWSLEGIHSHLFGFQPLAARSAAAAAFRSRARFRTAFQKSVSDSPSPSLMLCRERASIA